MSAPLLYLASKSPRRQALLRQLGIEFETLLLREAIGRRARHRRGSRGRRARAALRRAHGAHEGAGRLAADAEPQARRTSGAAAPIPKSCSTAKCSASRATPTTRCGCCSRLSGRTHQVLTAVAVRYRDSTRSRSRRVEGDAAQARRRGDRALRGHGRAARQGGRVRASRAAPRRSSPASKAATRASWACRCAKRRRCSRASVAPCYNRRAILPVLRVADGPR